MRKIYHILITLFVTCVFLTDLMAQEKKTLTGRVITEEGPAIGANVFTKGTLTGTVTDANGNYSIEVTSGDTIVFSYIGYVRKYSITTNLFTTIIYNRR